MQPSRPGIRMESAPRIPRIDFSRYRMQISRDRFTCRDYQERERELLWMRVWQIAGRSDDIPEPGDWQVYSILDQSFVLVRDGEGIIRGFVNSCRHRGNAFCHGRGHTARLTCPYHNWSYSLDGQLVGVARPDFEGSIEEFVGARDELGLIPVPVASFAGFIFLNPDPGAAPLTEFLGEAGEQLAAYRLEEMVPVGMNVREKINCNWKVVMDAFQEGYHVQGVHPELVDFMDMSRERFLDLGFHSACAVPFGGPHRGSASPEQEVEMFRSLPAANFPGIAAAMPRFEASVNAYRGQDGMLAFPDGVSARSLLQGSVRDTLTAGGLDVSELTDNQMSDYQFWALFPNVFMQLCPGEATVIIASPDSNGDPNRCAWHVTHYLWLPPEEREKKRTGLVEIAEDDHYPYFLALEQDYEQMQQQQEGLRNRLPESMVLTRQEPRVAHFHSTLDSWLESAGPPHK